MRPWVDAVADTVVLQPSSDAAIEDFVRFGGAKVGGVLARAGC
ncbi:hypothetical protein QN239_15475 [Mycolicibacterium sp. Y3]